MNEFTLNALSKDDPSWVKEKREKAFKEFQALEMPSFKYGIGIVIDVKELNLTHLHPEEPQDELVIVNPGAEILSFNNAIKKYPECFKSYFQIPQNKLEALHESFWNAGIFIKIPENTKLEPILLNLTQTSTTRIDNCFILAEKGSSSIIIDVTRAIAKEMFRSYKVNILVEENAQCEYRSLQEFGKHAYDFTQKQAYVQRNGFMHWTEVVIGSKFTQTSTKTFLQGKGSSSKSWGIFFGDAKQCYDINAQTIHVASRSTSDMATKIVLNHEARAVYRGLVKINPKAINCEGYQKDDTILLSEFAKADAVPNLEIAINEVKCSHGATISQIDEEKLFYMKSRGLNEETAKHAIIEGFFEPILKKMGNEKLQKEIQVNIAKRLGVSHETS